MIAITRVHLDQLVALESHVHYTEPPPAGVIQPFVVVERPPPVLVSAPHGARTFRNGRGELWHDEDEYTAGMALLLSELCGTAAIATIYRTDDSDPNYTSEDRSAYKREVRRLIEECGVCWVIDLHGLRHNRLPDGRCVDLGILHGKSMAAERVQRMAELIEKRLGPKMVARNCFPGEPQDTITHFVHRDLGKEAVQVEMVPEVRTALRRPGSTGFQKYGPFAARPERVVGMLQSLADFIAYLQDLP